MKRSIWSLGAGLLLIGAIFWIAWMATSGPITLGGFSVDFSSSARNDDPLPMNQAIDAVEAYLGQLDDGNLALSVLMQFDNHFYATIKELDSGLYAFELLVDPITGQVVPEPGPNMMWNKKYGHMSMGVMKHVFGQDQADGMAIDSEKAREIAHQFLSQISPNAVVSGQVNRFYGYYTLFILNNHRLIGMLSVNDYDGRVWLHSWHGAFLDMYQQSELNY